VEGKTLAFLMSFHHHRHHHKVHHIAPAPKVPTFLPVEGEPGVVILRTTDEGPEVEWAENPLSPQEVEALNAEIEAEALTEAS
jgi:hypothetical protein